MAKSIRSTDRALHGKGRLLPAFFLGALALPAAAGELGVDYVQRANGPLVAAPQWLGEPLRSEPRNIIAAMRVRASGQQAVGPVTLFAATGAKAYYRGDANVLVAAAADARDQDIDLPPAGRFPLKGRMQVLRSSDLGVVAQFQGPAGLALSLRPYLSAIHDYQRVAVDGAVTAQGEDVSLVGSLQRVGTRQYGYLVEERPDKGVGAGLDMDLAWTNGAWSARLEVENLLHRLWFSDVHYSNRTYNMATQDGKLVVRDVGEYSVSGEYGIRSGRESLPVHGQLTLRNTLLPAWQGGLVSLGNRASPWAGYTGRIGLLDYGLNTVALRNLSLDVGVQPVKGLRAGVGVTYASATKPALGRLSVAWSW